MKVIQLNNEAIMQHWGVIEDAINKALKHSVGESNAHTYLRKLSTNDYQCWVVLDDDNQPVNISITHINHYDLHKSLHLLITTSIGAGKWESYRAAHEHLERYAEEQGCRRIEFYGRPGWLRVIDKLESKRKYTQSYVVYSMEITNDE